jgi:hypothetical protein
MDDDCDVGLDIVEANRWYLEWQRDAPGEPQRVAKMMFQRSPGVIEPVTMGSPWREDGGFGLWNSTIEGPSGDLLPTATWVWKWQLKPDGYGQRVQAHWDRV